jgi:hypothetical protein
MALRTVHGGDLPALRPHDEPRPRAEPGRGDVPDGTDPHVWLGLSADERAYFARLEADGPLAYGPTLRHGGPMGHRGRNLYIKV